MRKADVTKLEVYEDVRVQFQTENLEQFDEVYVKKTGEIGFVKRYSGIRHCYLSI